MGRLITVAAVALGQWALDWEGNTDRIIESIIIAKQRGATLRVGSELEVPGYGCLDHFNEIDTYSNSWDMLRRILLDKRCYGIIIDVGAPILHRNQKFNCRIIILDGKILLIRPKMFLANDGNYREHRHFVPWLHPCQTEDYHLPPEIQEIVGVTHVPFGDAVISTPDTCLGVETCEELFTPNAPHINQSLDGVEIFANSSGSHFSLQKLDLRLSLITEATRKAGGVYIYSNQQGCDGDRLYYDGCAMVIVNGNIVAQGSQFSLNDVEVVTATVDLDEVRAHRMAMSRGLQAALSTAKYQRIQTDFSIGNDEDDADVSIAPSKPIKPRIHSVEEEIALCAGCYLWDYLRRSGAAGYLVPLSGGIDSCATATIVYSMCRIVIQAMKDGNQDVIDDVKRIAKYDEKLPETPQELCNQIFTTIYMGMREQSSRETRQRAKDLSTAIGSYHINLDIDEVFQAQKKLITNAIGFTPRFKVHGGTHQENLTLQCIQARVRMVTAYQFGQVLPTARGRPGGGGLLVLGSANVGESLVGYLTKYDCSSADINPIGSIDKDDLKRFIAWAETEFELPCLREFLEAIPTAELEPITQDYVQSDEADMGMTYKELTVFGRLRKEQKLGPYGMFLRLVHDWSEDRAEHPGQGPDDDAPRMTPAQVAEKVKLFFHKYCVARHKSTVLTPALHSNDYSPEDHRHDLRPFLYPLMWKSWSFKKIDRELARIEKRQALKFGEKEKGK